jgi:hypothetical protein
MSLFIRKTLLVVVAAACAASVQAAALYSAGATAKLASPSTVNASFNAGLGAGLIKLQLRGYGSLDGDSANIDIFHLKVNGVEVFTGTWALGGLGIDRVLFNPFGATATHAAGTTLVNLSVPVSFLAGANTVSYSYESPTFFDGTIRTGVQGLKDEGWSARSITITGKAPVVSVVPEPTTYTLFLAGLSCAGWAVRRRKLQD